MFIQKLKATQILIKKTFLKKQNFDKLNHTIDIKIYHEQIDINKIKWNFIIVSNSSDSQILHKWYKNISNKYRNDRQYKKVCLRIKLPSWKQSL